MPIILAQVVRQLVMALVTGGGIAALQAVFSDSMRHIVEGIRSGTGVSEQDAKDLVANLLIDTAINSGVTLALLKARLPVKIADYLGFSAGTVTKKALTPTAQKVATSWASVAGQLLQNKIVIGVLAVLGAIKGFIWLVNGIASTIEPGIYKPQQTNAVYKKLGIPFQYPISESAMQPGPFDGPGFSEYAKAIESQSPYAIDNPGALATFVYSRQALADLVDYIYGQEVLAGRAPNKTKFIPLLAPYIKTKGSTTPAAVSTPAVVAVPSTTRTVKVFTGIVSQGTLGSQTPFVARENDLINSAEELKQDAQQNAASFLASLPGKIQYEVRVVNSVLAADGSKRIAQTQQVRIGTLKSGAPRMKTVTNKFAVLGLFYSARSGTRSKLASITLGPTDVAQFNPSPQQLGTLGGEIAGTVHTSDLGSISQVVTAQPLAVASIATPPPIVDVAVFSRDTKIPGDTGYRFFKEMVNGRWEYEADPWVGNIPYGKTEITELEYRQATRDTKDYTNSGYRIIDGTPRFDSTITPSPAKGSLDEPAAAAAAATASAKLAATNLSEFYTAMGLPLPSSSDRGRMYESLGLGAASLYTGTLAQNTKLLSSLQGKG